MRFGLWWRKRRDRRNQGDAGAVLYSIMFYDGRGQQPGVVDIMRETGMSSSRVLLALRRLEFVGLILGEWVEAGGPDAVFRRKTYRLRVLICEPNQL